MMCLYLQMLILSSRTNGQIHIDTESLELSMTEYLAYVLDSKKDIVEHLLLFLETNHAIGHMSDKSIEIIEYKDCLKSGSESLHRVRKYRSIKQNAQCNVTEQSCNVTKKTCNVTENECNVTSQNCNVTNDENAENIELSKEKHTNDEINPLSSECNVTSQNCNVTEQSCNVTNPLESEIPIIEVIYEIPKEELEK